MTPRDRSDEIHFIGDEAPSPPEPKKRGFTIRRLMIAVVLVAFLFGIVRPIYLVFDAKCHGPFTVAFNRKCQRLADEAHLIGKPEAEVFKILGKPSRSWGYSHRGVSTRVYFYAIASFANGTFAVYCEGGVVKEVTQLSYD